MSHFKDRELFFLVPPAYGDGERSRIDEMLDVFESSGVWRIIDDIGYKDSTLGRSSYNPYNMFAMIVYCFAMRKGTLREMEELCRYDIRVMYIMNNEIPSHKTIAEFITQVIVPNSRRLFGCITEEIARRMGLDLSVHYVDGTKVEANANKYKFVWKPRKNHDNLDVRIRAYLPEIRWPKPIQKGHVKSKVLFEAIRLFRAETGLGDSMITTGRGIRLTKEQRLCVTGEKMLMKLLEYEEHERICGPYRNSYFKTDHDATAMCLKEDYYSGLGSNMHAAYNVQFMVSAGIVTMFGVFQDRSDCYTLVPLLEMFRSTYGKLPSNLCGDSGYGVFTNYSYLEEQGIGNFIKPLSWNGESSGKNPQMFFVSEEGIVTCRNGAVGEPVPFGCSHQKIAGSSMFRFSGCRSCGFAWKCKEKMKDKSQDFRLFEMNIPYEWQKNDARRNLTSLEGIEIRVNRSIQAEGTFGQLKQNMSYVRFRRRGLQKTGAEIMLMALGINIRKLFHFCSTGVSRSRYWTTPATATAKVFPSLKTKKEAITKT